MQATLANAVAVYDGQPCTTSLKIAEVFGKAHRSVLGIIRNLEAPADFVQHNFVRYTYTAANGKANPAYQITRDGFTLLAMGFTGKAAMRFKVAYIEAFNAMEKQLREAPALPVKADAEPVELLTRLDHRAGIIAVQITNLMNVVRHTHRIMPNGFVPPTVRDVADYCLEMHITNVDPHRFCEYYEARNWTRGPRAIPMVNWYNAVHSWSERKAVEK